MAKITEVNVDEGAATEGKRTRKSSGPRKVKPTHILFRVTDADGNLIEGAKLEVVLATKDTDAIIEAMDSNKDASRVRVNG